MLEKPARPRSGNRPWANRSTPWLVALRDRGGRLPRPRLAPGAWTAIGLCVMLFTGTEGYAEDGPSTITSTAGQVIASPGWTGVVPSPGCEIRVERWEASCIEKTEQPGEDGIIGMEEPIVDFDEFSLTRRQRDKDHLVYRSSEAFGPQFSLVVVEPRTRSFYLGLHLRFEYAF